MVLFIDSFALVELDGSNPRRLRKGQVILYRMAPGTHTIRVSFPGLEAPYPLVIRVELGRIERVEIVANALWPQGRALCMASKFVELAGLALLVGLAFGRPAHHIAHILRGLWAEVVFRWDLPATAIGVGGGQSVPLLRRPGRGLRIARVREPDTL